MDVELKEASGGLPAYGNARRGTLVVTGIGQVVRALASVIFPSECRICQSLLTTASRLPICDDCLASFRGNPLESCHVCAVPWSGPGLGPGNNLLDSEERWESVGGAFGVKEGGRVDNFRILLLDDVMTRGTTLDACSRALGDGGAGSVIAVTVPRAVRPASPAGR